MFFILLILEAIFVATIFFELRTGIAVTGWQGERPYVERANQPVHFWFVIALHVTFGLLVFGGCVYVIVM